MTVEVFLKFNKETMPSLICLRKWIEIFNGYPTTIICDLYPVITGRPTAEMAPVIGTMPVINTEYGLSRPFAHLLKVQRWHNVCASNLTCFARNRSDAFWLIDADDTQFLTEDTEMLRTKFRSAERYLLDKNLDGFSLDFYREIKKDHWSFGVALFRSGLDLLPLSKTTAEQLLSHSKGLILNFDSVLDYGRRTGRYRFQSFVFDRCFFQHWLEQNALPYGVYHWRDRKIWDQIPLRSDVVVL